MPTFSEAFEDHMSDVYAFFAYRLGVRADAEDLTQATFERAYRAWGRYDASRASVRTWLLAIARNLLIDHRRSARVRFERPLDADSGFAAADDPVDIGIEAPLADALAELTAREREILALRFGADLSGPEIAAVTNLTLVNVQQIMSRSLRRLRAALEPTRVS
jgi:RNA polymerase sigma-70 factor (ECF subfamily)